MEKAFIFFFHFFQIERVQKTWFELLHHEKRQSFFSPLLSLTLLLFPFPTTPFELFFSLPRYVVRHDVAERGAADARVLEDR